MNKIKKHIQEHLIIYTVAVAGITALIVRSTNIRGVLGEPEIRGVFGNTASFVFKNKQSINVTAVLDREGRGHPGWPVRNIETGRIFFSQKEAAEAFGISYTALSGHLNGKFPNVDGAHFERVSLL